MTREEIENSMTLKDAIEVFKATNAYGTMDIAKSVILKVLEQKPKSEWQHAHEILKAHSDGANEMLDTIRAEIEERKLNSGGEPNRELAFNVCLQIIDKYRAEREE